MTRGTKETTKALYAIYRRLLAETPYMDWQVTAGGLDYYVRATMEEILDSKDPRLDGKNYLCILIFQASFEMKCEMTCYLRHLLIKRLLQFFLLFMFFSATKRRYTITLCPSRRPSVYCTWIWYFKDFTTTGFTTVTTRKRTKKLTGILKKKLRSSMWCVLYPSNLKRRLSVTNFWPLREASLFMGWGGRATAEIAITLANHLIFASFLQSILLGP